MSHPNQAFGIMDEAYFVPRSEIIGWVNNLLHINLPKIQALGAGNVYCQIVDVIYPGKVSMNKVNWKAKLDYQFINNLKVLQNSFDKLGIKRHVDVEKIAKAKYQDNLELIQWLKRYYDVNCGGRGENYPAQERRGYVEPDFSFSQKSVTPKTYNASGQSTYNNGNALKIPKKESDPTKKVVSSGYGAPSTSFNQNIPQTNYQKPQQTKSVNDQKIAIIKQILGKEISNDEKVAEIEELVYGE